MKSNAEGEEDWKVLSLTHIEYPADDPLGKCFAIFSLLPLAIVVMFVTAFFLRFIANYDKFNDLRIIFML